MLPLYLPCTRSTGWWDNSERTHKSIMCNIFCWTWSVLYKQAKPWVQGWSQYSKECTPKNLTTHASGAWWLITANWLLPCYNWCWKESHNECSKSNQMSQENTKTTEYLIATVNNPKQSWFSNVLEEVQRIFRKLVLLTWPVAMLPSAQWGTSQPTKLKGWVK